MINQKGLLFNANKSGNATPLARPILITHPVDEKIFVVLDIIVVVVVVIVIADRVTVLVVGRHDVMSVT